MAVDVAPTGLPRAPWLPRSVAEGAAQGQGAVTRGVQLGHLRAGDVEDVSVGRCHEGARVPPAVLVRPVAVAAVSVGRGAGGAVEQLPRVALRGVVELGGEDSGAAGAAAQRSTLDDDGAVGQRGARRVPAREVHRGLVLEARAGAVARDADRGVVGGVATEAVVAADGEGRASVRHLDLHRAEEVGVGRVGDDPGDQVGHRAHHLRVPDVDLGLAALGHAVVAAVVVGVVVGAARADRAEGLDLAVGGQRRVDRHDRPRGHVAPRALGVLGGRRAVSGEQTGRVGHAVAQLRTHEVVGLVVVGVAVAGRGPRRRVVPERGVPRATGVDLLAPRDGVRGPLLADAPTAVGRLVDGDQRLDVLRGVDVPLVPLVGVGQRRLEALRQGAGAVGDRDGAAVATRGLGVAGGGRTDEATVEGVHVVLGLVGRPGRVVEADEAAATADVGLESGPLLGVEEHARGVGEDQEVLVGQVVGGERGGVGRLLDVGDGRALTVVVEAVLLGERVGHLPRRGAGVGDRAVHAVAAGEQQHAQHVVVGRGGGSGGRGLEGGDSSLGAAGSQRQRDGQRGCHGHEVR